jgi:hypothetical protein
MRFMTQCALVGGSVRVGLEDSLYVGRGQLAKSNAEQVLKARHIGGARHRDRDACRGANDPWPQGRRRRRFLKDGSMRLATDTGGTFTDLIVEDDDGSISLYKAATVPSDPVSGVLDALTIAADARGLSVANCWAGPPPSSTAPPMP